MNQRPLPDRLFFALSTVGVLLNATGLVPLILEPDGALYASIAKTIAQTGDFVNLYAQGRDWLDKPHFPFWVTALSFNLLGINSFAYKLPAFLFWGMGVLYTYRFARLVYPWLTAQVATLVVLTPYHLVLSNNDVRAEPYLTGLVIGSVYHFFRVYRGGHWVHLVLGALLAGCALMTKGLFVAIPIGAGLLSHWLLRGEWREVFRVRWVLAVGLTLVFTLPELYCLYQQFDLHPEKVVFGKTGVSGIRFFFWDSQFGRFLNTGPIRGAGDPFFFLHTLLWAFLPWSLLLYAAVGSSIRELVQRKKRLPGTLAPEYVSLGAGLATFLLFSASRFQLPHYLNLVFPFYALLTARFLVGLAGSTAWRNWVRLHNGVVGVLSGLAVWLLAIYQPRHSGWAVVWLLGTMAITLYFFRGNTLSALLGRLVGAAVLLFGFMNLFFFTDLLRYQAGGEAAFFINRNQPPQRLVGLYGGDSYSFEFYLHRPVLFWNDSTLLEQSTQQSVWALTTPSYADSLRQKGFSLKQVARFSYFHVSQPTGYFLNHLTRDRVLKPYVLLEVDSPQGISDAVGN